MHVLLYVPNVVGYVRLGLLAAAFLRFRGDPWLFIGVYVVFAFLDMVDGFAARVLGQTSVFGAWLDVFVDNIGRTLLWSQIYPVCSNVGHFAVLTHRQLLGSLVSSLEWTVFVCLHTMGSKWKGDLRQGPFWARYVFVNGQANLSIINFHTYALI